MSDLGSTITEPGGTHPDGALTDLDSAVSAAYPSAHQEFDSVEHTMLDGRRLMCWINRPVRDTEAKTVAVLLSGFGRRMHQHSTLCHYLVANGVAVVRFDPVNHVGLSEGEICDFSLSDCRASLEAALSVTWSHFPEHTCSLVATSLTARVALRLFQCNKRVARLIALSGVVNLRATLTKVCGVDYTTWAESALPEWVEFQSNKLKCARCYQDGSAHEWLSLSGTLREVATLTRPAYWFSGLQDAWVDGDDVKACAAASPGMFQVTWLGGCGHDIGRNSPIARQMTREVVTLCQGRSAGSGNVVVEPGFQDLLAIALKERRLQRGSRTV